MVDDPVFDAVVEAVCTAWNLNRTDLFQRRRYHRIAHPRHAVCHIMHKTLGYSKKRIAFLVEKDRTTIISAIRHADDWITTDDTFRGRYLTACQLLRVA